MLHMIGNAHLDPVWLWRWQEGCAEAIGTCWAAVDRLDEGAAFVFTRGEAQVYAWIEEFDPPLFERIRAYVAEGRWVVANGWWIQPDCNLPCGEAIIRQALLGKRYFREKFGVAVPVAYNVDSFGHAATLPMLLAHTGSEGYVFMRPGPHEMTLPAELFDWIAPDGSRVPTFRIQRAYNTSPRNMGIAEKIAHHLKLQDEHGHPFMAFYGVGNHGGGPTRQNIADIEAARAAGADVGFSDPDRYFKAVGGLARAEVATELQFHAIGCYAAAAGLKALNRRAEARLLEAETAATLAFRVAGTPYPRASLGALWRKLLFNQFHDTLGGTAIESACKDAEHDFGAVIAEADLLVNASLRQLTRTIAPPVDPRDATFVVANFNPADHDDIVEVEPWTDFDAASPRLLLDEAGAEVPFDHVSPEGKTEGLQRIAFRLVIPGYGYRTLRFARRDGGRAAPGVHFGRPLALEQASFETAGWRLVVDPETGAIAALVNRATGMAVFSGPAHRGILVDDPTDTWSHGIDRFAFEGEATRLEALNLLEDGALRLAVEIVTRVGDSRFATSVMLPADADLPVELRVRLDWHEQGKLFRIAYPLLAGAFEYEVPAGWTARPDDGKEVFGHRWVRAERDGAAVAIANDARYSYAAEKGVLYLTATRAPVYAHHDPVRLESGAVYRYLDQGEQVFTIRIGVDADATRAGAMRLADHLTRPPLATPHVARGGTAAQRGQWLATGGSGAVVALKLAEADEATILRAIELDGAAGLLAVGGRSLPIAPRGILSARLDGDSLVETDGLER